MVRLTFSLTIAFLAMAPLVHSQDSSSGLEEVPMQKQLLPYSHPLEQPAEAATAEPEPGSELQPISLHDREILNRIAEIYRSHLASIEAQLEEDPVRAEQQIEASLEAIQELVDHYPDLQENRRFVELYRSVIAEYRDFYDISGPLNEVEGEVFEVREELLSDLEADAEFAGQIERFDLPERVSFEQTDVPLVQNRHVTRHLVYYTLRRPEVMDRWLERSEKYFPMMREIFEDEGVPTELIHLSMIESGLNPTARSWAAAVGLWQFIRATGAMYGLEVNWWIDERRDPVKSTRAAARHLRDLYNIWGDWHLALANYNISPRGLRRAINAAGGVEDYWVAYPYLPRETRGYVPGYIAATMIAMNPVEFGFQTGYGGERWTYDVVEVDGLMPLEKLAEAAGISTQQLREYNPELLRWATPPGESYPLKIPSGIRDEFLAAYEQIPQDERVDNVVEHTVRSGENLGAIARRYGTSVQALMSTNENLSTTIHPGQRIVVPVAEGSMEPVAADRPSNSVDSSPARNRQQQQRQQAQAPSGTNPVTYTVKSGDTVGHIAEWFNVRAYQIRGWNNIGNVIRAGQELTIHVPEAQANYYRRMDDLSYSEKQELRQRQRTGEDVYQLVSDSGQGSGGESSDGEVTTYTVRSNDTLTEIANRFGVSVAEIQRVNNLRGTRIYAGQTLEIHTSR